MSLRLDQWFSMKVSLSHRGHLTKSADIFGHHDWEEDAARTWWVGARDGTQHPRLPGQAPRQRIIQPRMSGASRIGSPDLDPP